MKKYLISTLLILGLNSFAQQKIENLNFESFDKELPSLWTTFGDSTAKISADSKEKQEGKTSALFHATENSGFKALMYTLPENYIGKKITLSGYIKTENITDGFAGLWLRIDPEIAFDNMKKVDLKGTNDWKKYEVTQICHQKILKKSFLGLCLPEKAKCGWII
ncbi:hypothetical protein NAL32_12170 [Chryseobacterium sp. Ch-15]|uniref:Uncharacterized protein n=1 Tax=Chryseobacterium muglaense TaxID=2893752 RepID=A0A9Q3UXD5_9FLAO|nr:hypothetical protein [Chryseobacterium muglaense]MBD3904605.1 hypothetical protein [Chryseobacterium muglaense]MCC9035681.1 hypothetical protein [Chryseobacterium muglaense]MCM2555137.1 hypothetical protein [Chryseobacterium muglaense]